jgi:hypothetical protein
VIGSWAGGREYRASGHTEPVDADDPRALPMVGAALADGYELLTEAPLWCFLPALWPAEHRASVPDDRLRHSQRYTAADGVIARVPWTAIVYFEIEADYAGVLEECGVVPRPPARVWLLRMPVGRGSLEDYLAGIARAWRRQGGLIQADADFATYVAGEVESLFGPPGER